MAQNADSTAVAASSEQNQTEDISVNELVFGHIGDAYEWHIATLGNTVVSIPLPVIVHSSTGWHVFSSSRLEEGEYEGLYIARGGAYDGKIVERNEAGEEVRPLDISITKNVIQMHHGVIDVESTPGEGTTFSMRIPLNYVPRQEERL